MSASKSTASQAKYTSGNKVELVGGGKPYFDLLIWLINEARESIHLQTYIYSDDETGRLVANALIAAAKRNVEVFLLVDGYASRQLSTHFVNELKQSGIHFRFFDPVFNSKYYYFGRRLHHKLAVVDTRHAVVGGINISNSYNDLPGKSAWLDFALHVEGEIVRELCVLCWKSWHRYKPDMGLTPCEEKQIDFDISPDESIQIRMRRNDWVRRKNQVSKSYLEILRQAKSEIIIISSYFLPGKKFRNNISAAIKRGVKIKLVLAGTSDVSIAKDAERHIYRWLFKNNVEVYEYQPGILHGKMAICDDQLLTIGSYNVNNISAFASIELNLDVSNQKFVHSVKQHIEEIIRKDCAQVVEKKFIAHNHFLQRLWQDTCYETIRLLFYLFTFYFKQKE